MSFIKWVIRHPWLVLTTLLGMLGASWSYKRTKAKRAKVEAKVAESQHATRNILKKIQHEVVEIEKEIEELEVDERLELALAKAAETQALSAYERRKKMLDTMKP